MSANNDQIGALRLASYNIRKAVGLDLRRDPVRTLDVIAELKADIVALQEADKRLGRRAPVLRAVAIAEQTGMRPLTVAENGHSLGWHGNALLVRPGIKVRDVTRLPLPGLEPRGAIMAELITPHGPLTVIAAHLGLRRKDRFLQSRAILKALDNAPTTSAIVLGDMNEWRPIGGLAPFHDALQLVAPGHSFHATVPLAPLDRFALGGMEMHNAGVSETKLARRASDHLPVWIDVHLQP